MYDFRERPLKTNNFLKMKKLFILLMLFPAVLFAQEKKDTLWTKSGSITLNFSQVSLTNWAAGGNSSVSGLGMFKYDANYKKDKLSWDNSFDLQYGLIKQDDYDHVRKSNDLIDISSKLGIQASDYWYYSALVGFKSQFATGYEYDDDDNTREKISNFMSPGYLTAALGMDYKRDKFSVLLAPLSGKATYVTDDDLVTSYGVDEGKNARYEFGATIDAKLKTEIMKNVTFDTELTLFSNYLDKPQNVDVEWKTQINMKINDYLSANLLTHLIYDDDVEITDSDGKTGARLQFMESFGVGLTVKF
jgi:hypothetical protein